ncbi:hypothetical protein HanIR_Chr14g0726881 [Helianthus annuus]|nr:hypothetical protein HanIR_Chr14g0726881 [Helianthus annuus]
MEPYTRSLSTFRAFNLYYLGGVCFSQEVLPDLLCLRRTDHAQTFGSAPCLFFGRDFTKKTLLEVFLVQIWTNLFKTLQNTSLFQGPKP